MINLFRQVFNANYIIAVITVVRHYKRELLSLPTIGHLPAQSQQKTLE